MRYSTPCPECGGFDAIPELTQGMSIPQLTGRRRCFCGHLWTPIAEIPEDRLVARVLREVAAAVRHTGKVDVVRDWQWLDSIEARAKELER